MAKTVSYKNAVRRAVETVGHIKGLNAFNMSLLIAHTYSKDKNDVLDDMIKEASSRLSERKKLKRVM